MKKTIILITMILLSSMVFAQNTIPQDTNESEQETLPKPGLLPNHPLYGLKLAWETVLSVTAFSGEAKAERAILVAEQRLSEALELQKQGRTQIVSDTITRYEERLEEARDRATSIESSVVRKRVLDRVKVSTINAVSVLQEVLSNAPESAKPALQRALDNVQARQVEVEDEGGEIDVSVIPLTEVAEDEFGSLLVVAEQTCSQLGGSWFFEVDKVACDGLVVNCDDSRLNEAEVVCSDFGGVVYCNSTGVGCAR